MKKIFYLLSIIFSQIAFSQNNWQAVGPIQFPVDVSGQINGIGRTTQLKFHPSDPQKLYATTASGGLWISGNAGTTWTKTGTDALPQGQLASVCIDYTNDQILYIGTGDPNYYGTSYGVWKSTDGGATWNAANNGMGNLMAVELWMSPNDHNTLVAATNNGIWKTTDGGANWTQKLNSGQFTDMKVHPTNANIMYAASMDKYFRSADMGNTWTQITSGLTGSTTLGDGCRLAVSPASPNVVYLATVKDEGTVFRSNDAGLTFTVKYHNPSVSLTGYDAGGGGQGNYNFSLAADPSDANIVWTGSHVVWKSTNGGTNFTKLTDWWADLHTDMHQMQVSPYNPNLLLNMNDGGIFTSTDGGDNWQPFSDGLEATECYHAATSPSHPHLISIGTQDNGELFDFNTAWKTNRGGDWGARMWYDYIGNGNVYYPDGYRRNTSSQGSSDSVQMPIQDAGRTRYAFTATNPNLGVGGSKNIYLTTNLTQNASNITWSQIYSNTVWIKDMQFSPDDSSVLYVVLENDKILRCDNIFATTPNFVQMNAPSGTGTAASIAPLTNTSNIVYVSCGNKVYRSTDRGQTWTNYSGTLPPINIINVIWDRFSTDESLYLGTGMSVYYRNNLATDWLGYNNGLPTIAEIQDLMIYNEGNVASKLRVAYYGRGVWESDLYSAAAALPYTQFSASGNLICTGQSINFTDATLGNPSAWAWTFAGGTPATSTQQNPAVTYNTAGIYQVTLTSTNANGSDAEIKYGYITVLNPAQGITLSPEGFETGVNPANWTENNIANDNLRWEVTADAGGFSTSAHSLQIDNFNHNGSGARDEIRMPVLNFSNLLNPKLTFDVAYTTYPGYADSLIVMASTDCGATYTRLYAKGGSNLSTAPETQNYFVPQATEWNTDTVDLTGYVGQSSVLISFQNFAGYGQPLYVDNILIKADTLSSLLAAQILAGEMGIFPNPNQGTFSLQVKNIPQGNYQMKLIDASGKTISSEELTIFESIFQKEYTFTSLASGTYFVILANEKGKKMAKMSVK